MTMKHFSLFLLCVALLMSGGANAWCEVIAPVADSAEAQMAPDAEKPSAASVASAADETAKDAVLPPEESQSSSAEGNDTVHPEKNDKPALVLRDAEGKPLPDINGKLTLEDCIQIALANSPQAVAAQLNLQNANVNLNLSKAEFLPTLTAGASQGYSNSKMDGSSRTDHGSSDVYAQAQLSISGITDKVRNVKIQQGAVEQAELNLESVKNDIIRTVKKNYYALLSAVRAVGIRTQSRDLYKDQYERAAEYFRLGLRPKVDVTTAEVNLNNEELSLIRAKNLVKTQTAALANVMGVTREKPLILDDTIEAEPFTLTFDQALTEAYANRPDVRSSKTALEISEIKLNQAKAGYWPTFTLGASFSKSGDEFRLDNDKTRLFAGVEIPIFSALNVYNGVKRARINLSSAQNSDRSLSNDVFLEVQNAFIALNEAAESIPVAQSTVEKAKENLDLARGRYNEGIGDMIALKDAEVAYTDSELNLLTARYDYAVALAELKKAMGTR